MASTNDEQEEYTKTSWLADCSIHYVTQMGIIYGPSTSTIPIPFPNRPFSRSHIHYTLIPNPATTPIGADIPIIGLPALDPALEPVLDPVLDPARDLTDSPTNPPEPPTDGNPSGKVGNGTLGGGAGGPSPTTGIPKSNSGSEA
ncbi:hypothetical protein LTR02_001286, partial [Friedmanniomyces endolithicus]